MIRIVTDSVASIPAEVAQQKDIEVVSLFVNHEGVEYEDATMDVDEFYKDIYSMIDAIPTSSQPSQAVLEALFEEAAQAGDEVLGVFISSKMSGTYDGAILAARAVKAHHIDFHCILIDSTSNSYDEAWPVFDGCDGRDEGLTLEECAAAVQKGIESTRFLFTPESLTFLRAGGRIGGAAALIGNLIQLVPVLTVRDGEATTFAKVRTRKKALARIVETLQQDIEQCGGLKRIAVHYIGEAKPALEWARSVIDPLVGFAVDVRPVSPVIGLHVGPAIGIAYECMERIKDKISLPTAEREYSF